MPDTEYESAVKKVEALERLQTEAAHAAMQIGAAVLYCVTHATESESPAEIAQREYAIASQQIKLGKAEAYRFVRNLLIDLDTLTSMPVVIEHALRQAIAQKLISEVFDTFDLTGLVGK